MNVIGLIVVGIIGAIYSAVYLKYPETVQRLAMSYAVFTPDDWIKRPGYLLYIRIKGILSLTMTVVLLSIGIRNLLK